MRSLLLKCQLTLLGLLLCSPLMAATCDRTCCALTGDFSAGIHALVFLPIHCDYDFARQGNTVGEPVRIFSANCDLDWGLRVFGRYDQTCWFAGASYQWYEGESNFHARSETNSLHPRDLNVGKARIEGLLRLEYQNLDGRVGTYLHKGDCTDFYLFGNIRWIDLSYRRRLRSVQLNGGVESTNEKSQLSGGALGIGFGTELSLLCDLGLFAEANMLGIIGQRRVKTAEQINTSDQTTPAFYPSETCISPEFALRIGLTYEKPCGCYKFVGELGYELDYFWDAFAFPKELNQNALIGSNGWERACESVGFSGLFFGGRLYF